MLALYHVIPKLPKPPPPPEPFQPRVPVAFGAQAKSQGLEPTKLPWLLPLFQPQPWT